MTAQELIQRLQTLAPDTKIVVRLYEGGYNIILKVRPIKIKTNAEVHWYDGEYKDCEDADAIDAVDLFGENQYPKDDLK